MKTSRLTYYIDALICVVILPAMIMLLPIDRWLEQRLLFVILLVSWLYAIYFAMRAYIVPSLFRRGTRDKFISLIIVVLSLVATNILAQFEGSPQPQRYFERIGIEDPDTRRMIVDELGRRPGHKPPSYQMQKQAVWFLYFITSSFGLSVALLTMLYRNREINQEIIHEKKKAELALYKAQINPHFLFNTLNTLYGLVVTKSDRAEEAFILFTNQMKYIYSNGSADRVELCNEIEYIEQYIELQRLRMSAQTEVEYSCSEAARTSNLNIAPMMLITFIENIFKHGISTHNHSLLRINIDLVDGVLIMTTENPIVAGAKKSSGIGVANCRERLELLYTNRYKLHIRQSEHRYNLNLNIRL
ncbi:MAG: histidine kinase [Rikenellaceae bacterium]